MHASCQRAVCWFIMQAVTCKYANTVVDVMVYVSTVAVQVLVVHADVTIVTALCIVTGKLACVTSPSGATNTSHAPKLPSSSWPPS